LGFGRSTRILLKGVAGGGGNTTANGFRGFGGGLTATGLGAATGRDFSGVAALLEVPVVAAAVGVGVVVLVVPAGAGPACGTPAGAAGSIVTVSGSLARCGLPARSVNSAV
jgi:hypothetical protein